MTQDEVEQIMLLIPQIWENAVRNKAYYQQAERVCAQLTGAEVRVKEIARIKTKLAELIRTNYQTKDYIEKMKEYIRLGKVYNFDMEKNIQEMAFWLLASEKERQALFQNETFKTHIEPGIPKFCCKYMNKSKNQEIAGQVRAIIQSEKQTSEDLIAN